MIDYSRITRDSRSGTKVEHRSRVARPFCGWRWQPVWRKHRPFADVSAALGRDGCSRKLLAECLGTATLVLFGCGSAVLAGSDRSVSSEFHSPSACRSSPWPTASARSRLPRQSRRIASAPSSPGRMSINEMVQYWVAQVIGALIGAGILYLSSPRARPAMTSRSTASARTASALPIWAATTSMTAALAFEIVATFLFVV
jgi:aquaporin Z